MKGRAKVWEWFTAASCACSVCGVPCGWKWPWEDSTSSCGFKLMDKQEIRGRRVDLCICVMQLEKSVVCLKYCTWPNTASFWFLISQSVQKPTQERGFFTVRGRLNTSSDLVQVDVSLRVCALNLMWGNVGLIGWNGWWCNHMLILSWFKGRSRADVVFPHGDNSLWKSLESVMKL